MADGPPPIRRVVTGTDEKGRSRVVWDGPAPNAVGAPKRPGGGHTDMWVFEQAPAILNRDRDDGHLPYSFEPPERGGHLRITHSPPQAPGHVPSPEHEPIRRPGTKRTWERGGLNLHQTDTVDYAIQLIGTKRLILDDGERVLDPGDIVIQLGAWHGWAGTDVEGRTAFVMINAERDEA